MENSKNISESNAKSKLTKSTLIESKELFKSNLNCELNKGYSTSSSLLQKRSKWTKEEDNKLLNLRNNNYNWKDISLQLNKDQKKCIYRYKRLTNDKFSKWLMEEDTLLLQLTNKYGEKFSEFTSYFPNKSERKISERYRKIKLLDNVQFTQEEDNFILKVYSNREDLGLTKKSNLSLLNNQDSDIFMENFNKSDYLNNKDNSFLKFGNNKENNREIQSQLKNLIQAKGVRNVRKRIESLLNVKGEEIDISFNISSILSSTLSSQSTNNNLSGLSNIIINKNDDKLNKIEEELYSNKNYYEDDSFVFFNKIKSKKVDEDITMDEDSNKKVKASDTSNNNSSIFDNIEKDIFYLIDNNNSSYFDNNNIIDNDFFNNYEDLNISESDNFFKFNENKHLFETNDDEIFNSKDIKEFFEKDLVKNDEITNEKILENKQSNSNNTIENAFKLNFYNKKYSQSTNNIVSINTDKLQGQGQGQGQRQEQKQDQLQVKRNSKNKIFKIDKVKEIDKINSYNNINPKSIYEQSFEIQKKNELNVYDEFFNNKYQYFERNLNIDNPYNQESNLRNDNLIKKSNENNKEKMEFFNEVNKIKDIDNKIIFLLEKNSQLFTILNKSKEISDCFSLNVKSKINNINLQENKNPKIISFVDLFKNLDHLEIINSRKYDEKLIKLKSLSLKILKDPNYSLSQNFIYDNAFIKDMSLQLKNSDMISKDSLVRYLMNLIELFFNSKRLIKLKMKLLKGIYS